MGEEIPCLGGASINFTVHKLNYGRIHHSIDGFPLAKRQFSRDPPLILLKERVTVCILEFWNTRVIQRSPGDQTTTRTIDPQLTFCRSLSKVEHAPHLDCVNRLQMIFQNWTRGSRAGQWKATRKGSVFPY